MMLSSVSLLLISLPIYYVITSFYGLWKNVQKAKKSGLPYVIVRRRLLKRLIRKYPDAWVTRKYLLPVASLLIPEWTLQHGYGLFRKFGDTFMTVTPANCHIWIADRHVISQVSSRREDFPKPAWMYRTVNIFGRNVVTTEGAEWRLHRKITAPSFGDRNNSLVFKETIRQGLQMLRKWTGDDGAGNITIKDVLGDTMRLSLHVISGAGFGVPLQWPGTAEDAEIIHPVGSNSLNRHSLSFKDALAGLLHNLWLVLIFPKWLLRNAPFRWAKKAAQAAVEYETYMDELFAEKKREAIAGEKADGMDIMGALVKNSYGPESRINQSTGKSLLGDIERQTLSDSEILGNAFMFLLAGHETSAGALHYGMTFLALYPEAQRQLQADIDRIFGDRPVEEWDYNRDVTAMQNSMIAAVMHEELRMVPPVINIPKQVSDHQDQAVMVDGKQTLWPKGAVISLCAYAIHRNPKYWPSTGKSKVTGQQDDLEDFMPKRWLSEGREETRQEISGEDEEPMDKDAGRLFHPLKGSYIPFSDGARSCLGKRFAQVEIMILLALIFRKYSVELAVDEAASDEEISRMGPNEKIRLYDAQRAISRTVIRNCSMVRLTIQIRSAYVPIRLVPRGEERFVNLLDH
ncbi:hypothetical protein Dda_1954 [Drechslerella dactyloides]|uniref:Cytochrome P450 n=1 Tax=Drechslerella dactyloides TaxID=74499 RepID=A0AAD6J3H9_DREDA|nr:hypothetical protein Dda_1954 [Drechslerella dactyloides]